jgi:hypothetical protein
MSPNAQATKEKNRQYILHEKFLNMPQNTSKYKNASYISVNLLLSRIYTDLLKINNKRTNNLIKNGQKT